jgi:uncharacterized protein YndB with AHSA1/START domain
MTSPTAEDEALLSFEYQLAEPREKVWRALTIPAYLERWLMPMEQAGEQEFRGRGDDQSRIEAKVLEADAPGRLKWHWREDGPGGATESLVTFTLGEAEDGGTRLRIEQRISLVALPQPANSNTPMAMAA